MLQQTRKCIVQYLTGIELFTDGLGRRSLKLIKSRAREIWMHLCSLITIFATENAFQYSLILFVFAVQAHREEDNPSKTMEVNGPAPVSVPVPDSYDYDLIVIGGGSGGLAAAKV